MCLSVCLFYFTSDRVSSTLVEILRGHASLHSSSDDAHSKKTRTRLLFNKSASSTRNGSAALIMFAPHVTAVPRTAASNRCLCAAVIFARDQPLPALRSLACAVHDPPARLEDPASAHPIMPPALFVVDSAPRSRRLLRSYLRSARRVASPAPQRDSLSRA